MRKKIVPILLILLIFVSSFAYAEELMQMYVLCNPNDYVNARYSASTKSSVEGRLECGDIIETDGEVKKDKQGRMWVHIVNPSFESDSWVCNMYLQDTEVVVRQCTGYVVGNGKTALRRSPKGKRIKWVTFGTELTILAMSDEWALTTQGYIMRDYLEVFYD